MSWDPIWNDVFRSQAWGKYPPEELIRFVARHFYAAVDRSMVRVLDAGCGPGAGVWYLAREGFDAWGVEGSPAAVEQASARLADDALSGTVVLGDLLALPDLVGEQTMDAVLDVTAVQHNRVEAIGAIHDGMERVLKPGGRVFALMVTDGTWGDGLGVEVEPATYTDISDGPLRGKGLTHFSTRADVESLFERYDDVEINTSARTLAGGTQRYAHWVVEGRKRA